MTHQFTLLDGKETSKALLERLAREVDALNTPKPPKLVAVLVGNDPASEIYVASKMKKAAKVGIDSDLRRLDPSASQEHVLTLIDDLNRDSDVHAILVQLPLPKHIDSNLVLNAVRPEKDVDGFHPENLGKLLTGVEPAALPCTPAGTIHLMDTYHISLEGKRAAVVGRSNIVGKPISLMMLHRNATVTICHSRTRDLDDILRDADVVIAAAGRPGLVKAEAIKPGAVVIDVGINRLETNKIVGDVDFDAVKERAGYITPVPGGVGPMTIATLLRNTYRLCKAQQGMPNENLLLV